MAAEMLEQPAVLTRLIDRAPADAARVRAAAPDPLAGVVFLARARRTMPPCSAGT
jgi:hypothetical protein